MGKKTKVGKARKDKFYQLAKETGYRSRAAFKLIQLNRKFEFLQTSKVVIDLCAAPGGWMQVVAENTPVSSLIVGVDLVPIKPIHNCVSLQQDITTEKCRQELKKSLQTWKADCVLNDGAPNVGKNWLHDAFQQSQLTLQALKLAVGFLRKGGWFVTKIFRSKDYNSLLWVFQQLFRHVHATKPKASRTESAEIFVVCQNFLAPDRIDPKFLDPIYVFKDLDSEPSQKLDLMHPEKIRRQREGYAEGDYTLHHKLNASDFINSSNHLELLAQASEVVLDSGPISSHPETTTEIQECLKDIKVLGKKEIRAIINWRKKLKKDLDEKKEEKSDIKTVIEEEDESEDGDAKMEEKLAEMKEEERKNLKRKLKKVRKEKTKLRHKMDMKMVLPNDHHDFADDVGLFNLSKIKSKKQLDEVEAGDLSVIDAELAGADMSDEDVPQGKNVAYYDRENNDSLEYMDALGSEDEGEELEWEEEEETSSENENNVDEEEDNVNPLMVSLDDTDSRTQRKLDMWFNKESFAGLEDDEDEDMEVEKMAEDYKQRGGVVCEKPKKSENNKAKKNVPVGDTKNNQCSLSEDLSSENLRQANSPPSGQTESDADDSSDSDSDYDTNEMLRPQQTAGENKMVSKSKGSKRDGFEVVPAGQIEDSEALQLDPVGLAIGAAMVQSRKRRRDIIDDGYHRFMFDEEGLPGWFVQDEAKHNKRQLPVTKADIDEYKEKKKGIDARPIKKIAEAKARKKRKEMKKLEKVRKRADVISDSVDVSEREKWQQIKNMYKRAGLLSNKKKEVAYVVAKKGVGKRVRRPQGVQGPFKVVDPRMKKDSRNVRESEKKARGKGKRKGGSRMGKGKGSGKTGKTKGNKGKK